MSGERVERHCKRCGHNWAIRSESPSIDPKYKWEIRYKCLECGNIEVILKEQPPKKQKG